MLPTRRTDYSGEAAGYREDGATITELVHRARIGADDLLSIVAVNVTSTVELARLVLADMVARGSGRALISSSIASLMPGSRTRGAAWFPGAARGVGTRGTDCATSPARREARSAPGKAPLDD
jgi:NAD(P)-dependent dehydrogenase (short-subunit alcohol dehydrogenase family)